MTDSRRISICIPTWERFEMLFKSFEQVISDKRVCKITIKLNTINGNYSR